VAIAIGLAAVVAAGAVVFSVVRVFLPASPTPTLKPGILPATTASSSTPTPVPSYELAYESPATPVPYNGEVIELDEKNKFLVGQLQKGDCVNGDPDASWFKSETLVAPVVDCSQPPINQVAGFVDVSDHVGGVEGERTIIQRCNSLIASLPVWDQIDVGVLADYPDPDEIAEGYTVAVCWVPIFNKTWVGSAVDGTGEVVS
jgi:hypothetical protein